MDYLPALNSLSGFVLYSFIGYVVSIVVASLLTPREYGIEDFREALRRDRKNKQ